MAQNITEVDDLLAQLRANPHCRAVSYCRDDEAEYGESPALVEFTTTSPTWPGRVIAWIEPASAAAKLLDQAHDVDVAADNDAFAKLPLRYGPYCSTWVLPEHPLASQKAGEPAKRGGNRPMGMTRRQRDLVRAYALARERRKHEDIIKVRLLLSDGDARAYCADGYSYLIDPISVLLTEATSAKEGGKATCRN